MQFEEINEPVEVLASFKQTDRGAALVVPEVINWRGRRLQPDELGLRWPTTKGQRMIHRLTFQCGEVVYELEFDAERLTWMLLGSAEAPS